MQLNEGRAERNSMSQANSKGISLILKPSCQLCEAERKHLQGERKKRGTREGRDKREGEQERGDKRGGQERGEDKASKGEERERRKAKEKETSNTRLVLKHIECFTLQ